MQLPLKLAINCLVVAGLTVAGFFVFILLPVEALQWIGERTSRPATSAFWFVYSVLNWAVLGAVIAACMLLLRPRRIVLYGITSVAAFVFLSQPWGLQTTAGWFVRELVFTVTIPLLYWLFVSLVRRKQGQTSEAKEGIA